MEKYVAGLFASVIVVALTGLLIDAFNAGNRIQGNAVQQRGAIVMIGKTTSQKNTAGIQWDGTKSKPIQSYTPQAKKATTGLIITDGMQYKTITATAGLGTTMAGMINIGGISVSRNTLEDHCITFGNDGLLHTPDKKQVQIRDAELRRKPIKAILNPNKCINRPTPSY